MLLAFPGQLFSVSPLKLLLIHILSVMVFNIKMRTRQVPHEHVPLFKA